MFNMNAMNLDVEMADENDGQISPLLRAIPPAPITGDADTEDEEERSFSSNDSSYVDDDKEQCENKRAMDENQIRDENVNATTIRAAPVELPTKTRLKIRVEKLYVTAEWKWTEGGDDTCGICRMPFEACCVDCKCPGDECPLVLGHCKHPFHMHCIVKWTEAQNTPKPQCPLCRQEWKFAS